MMTVSTDDHRLIAECRAGRTEAFGTLVQKYQDRLYPTALRLTGGAEDAMDLLQDAFFQAFRKLKSFQGDSSFYTWVYRVMVNLALSGRRKRTPKLFRQASQVETVEPVDTSETSDPSAQLVRQERETAIQNALNQLATDQRVVVVMKEFDGLRYDEIAAALKIPIGTVRSRLHRAREELKEMLSAFDIPPTETTEPVDPVDELPPGSPANFVPTAARGR
jgi:RNA polymerase sigma-70 factor (ECF subfamily)